MLKFFNDYDPRCVRDIFNDPRKFELICELENQKEVIEKMTNIDFFWFLELFVKTMCTTKEYIKILENSQDEISCILEMYRIDESLGTGIVNLITSGKNKKAKRVINAFKEYSYQGARYESMFN